MSRAAAYGFGLGLTVLSALPAFWHPNDDSFPLSTYPMFARPRNKPTLYSVEGVSNAGVFERLAPELVANEEVMQAAVTVRRAVRGGAETTAELCRRVAERVAEVPALAHLVRVEVIASRYDAVGYFTVGPKPEAREVVGSCSIRSTP